jgi:cell wall-associated NlpC family hydrolase
MNAVDSLLAIAKKEIGYKEGQFNDTKYGVWFGWNRVAWCAIFVNWVFAQAGAGNKILKTAGCIELEAWGIKNKLTVPVATVQAGDIVLFDFTKSGKAQHVGIATGTIDAHTHLLPTIEGNTGPDHVGVNQANGDGVYAKIRNPVCVRTVIRIKL